jgi:phage terminase large subunit GpA-like protein
VTTLTAVRRAALRSLIPPPKLRLSEWIEASIVLPSDVSALPGRVRLWPYMREICDAISNPEIERVTVVKAARIGYTLTLTGVIANYVLNEPCPILCMLPVESDCRD